MKKKYVKPFIVIKVVQHHILAGSVTVTVPDMGFACGCECSDCNKGNHHPQSYSITGEYCDYWDDLNDPFL